MILHSVVPKGALRYPVVPCIALWYPVMLVVPRGLLLCPVVLTGAMWFSVTWNLLRSSVVGGGTKLFFYPNSQLTSHIRICYKPSNVGNSLKSPVRGFYLSSVSGRPCPTHTRNTSALAPGSLTSSVRRFVRKAYHISYDSPRRVVPLPMFVEPFLSLMTSSVLCFGRKLSHGPVYGPAIHGTGFIYLGKLTNQNARKSADTFVNLWDVRATTTFPF